MNMNRKLAAIAVAAITLAVLSPNAGAQIPIQKISVTISEPLEVPNLVLPIGTYVFEALENGRVTRILSADESRIYTTLLTQPEERREPLENPLVTLKEGPKGDVQRIDSWFYAGESIGNEFLYAGTGADGKSESRLRAFTKDAGHVVASGRRCGGGAGVCCNAWNMRRWPAWPLAASSAQTSCRRLNEGYRALILVS
jgi:hypothetical protein